MEYWKPDKLSYNKIQELKKFVKFVSNLEFAEIGGQSQANEIIHLIESIDKPETYKNWCVYLNIFDRQLQEDSSKEGVYWRKWLISFESGVLQIEAESKQANELGHHGNDFSYYGEVYFTKDISCKRINLDVDIREFINDAQNYEKYITESLNDIEVDIEL